MDSTEDWIDDGTGWSQRLMTGRDLALDPVEVFRWYADALRGGWSVDGRAEKEGINAFIDAVSSPMTERELLAVARRFLGVYVVELRNPLGATSATGYWEWQLPESLREQIDWGDPLTRPI